MPQHSARLDITPFPEKLACQVSHLRFLARQIVERGALAPPLDAHRHLQPVLPFYLTKEGERRLVVTLLEEAAGHRREARDDEDARALESVIPLVGTVSMKNCTEHRAKPQFQSIMSRISSQRRGPHSTRQTGPADMLFASAVLRPDFQPERERIILQWVSWSRDERFALGIAAAPRLEHLAEVVERMAGVGPCPPRLGRQPPGRWRNIVHGLVMKLDVSSECIVARMSPGDSMEVDFVAGGIRPDRFDLERDRNLIDRCGEFLDREVARLGEKLRIAKLAIRLSPRGNPVYEVQLEAWASGDRIESRRLRVGPLTYVEI